MNEIIVLTGHSVGLLIRSNASGKPTFDRVEIEQDYEGNIASVLILDKSPVVIDASYLNIKCKREVEATNDKRQRELNTLIGMRDGVIDEISKLNKDIRDAS
jgi:hypothetical protein